ncbi:MAG: acetamidase/formamidase family protein [Streptosporangiaceae bacterium]
MQLFNFERGQSSGFATFTGTDTGRQARIPIAPFMGTCGVAPLRKGVYRTFPPNVSGGNTDVRQLVKGSRLQLPVYVEGVKFTAGDGHMAQGDGEVTGAASSPDRPATPGGNPRRERGECLSACGPARA